MRHFGKNVPSYRRPKQSSKTVPNTCNKYEDVAKNEGPGAGHSQGLPSTCWRGDLGRAISSEFQVP